MSVLPPDPLKRLPPWARGRIRRAEARVEELERLLKEVVRLAKSAT